MADGSRRNRTRNRTRPTGSESEAARRMAGLATPRLALFFHGEIGLTGSRRDPSVVSTPATLLRSESRMDTLSEDLAEPKKKKGKSPYFLQPARGGSVTVLRKPCGNRIDPKVCGTMPSRVLATALVNQLERAESAVNDLFYEATDDGIEALEAVLAACRESVLARATAPRKGGRRRRRRPNGPNGPNGQSGPNGRPDGRADGRGPGGDGASGDGRGDVGYLE
jgi:hypothetical protein